ncbi:uncharacterized protein LOC134164409 [Pezoporus occidentalis]|uniref:uncharacterized protein LOC134164409 n=1 Tax=Pezoporus occidentalis TaxID=407982 RepID=UPI002F90861C
MCVLFHIITITARSRNAHTSCVTKDRGADTTRFDALPFRERVPAQGCSPLTVTAARRVQSRCSLLPGLQARHRQQQLSGYHRPQDRRSSRPPALAPGTGRRRAAPRGDTNRGTRSGQAPAGGRLARPGFSGGCPFSATPRPARRTHRALGCCPARRSVPLLPSQRPASRPRPCWWRRPRRLVGSERGRRTLRASIVLSPPPRQRRARRRGNAHAPQRCSRTGGPPLRSAEGTSEQLRMRDACGEGFV